MRSFLIAALICASLLFTAAAPVTAVSGGACGLATHAHECASCGGSGKCWICSGSGKRTSGDKCTSCNGSGDCWYCGGKGS